jgi:hypothetical protein
MMTRNLKTLGLAIVAALALSAVLASAAAAEAGNFAANVAEEETAKIDGSQIGTNTFTINGLSVTCATANLTGKAKSAGPQFTEVSLEPVNEKCDVVVAGIKKTATFTTNGCTYVLNATRQKTESGVDYPVDLAISCAEGKQIEVHIYNEKEAEATTLCTYDVKAQTLSTGITATNKENTPTSADDVIMDLNVTSIAATNTKTSAVCGTSETVTASYKGESTFQATTEGGETVDLEDELVKRFRTKAAPTIITGTAVDQTVLTTSAGELKCTASLEGKFAKDEATETTYTPSYTACKLDKLDADVNFNGCTYRFGLVEGVTKTEGGGTHTNGPFHIDCGTGKKIEIVSTEGGKAKCTITIPAQERQEYALKNTGGIGNARDALYTSEINDLFYEVDNEPACGNNEIDGVLHGSFTMKAYVETGSKEGAQTGMWIG